ncbi:hypothetical protein L0F81_40720 [Streptomyces tricolor]|uniref:Restriction endonuclease n=1 Tax=Streptomyces tricolor TaxID=68277 RepID=A0ABS9JVL3_9ACTN|nr:MULTISPECIES: hypothetical protein [Streptomyces]MCG0069509.1 hypothetical protein [Streptomyces tricolor]BCM67167.1 hypothetical protein EASAB2608_02501 [Streptomyces sp. EAS-AB2608]
MATSLEHEFLSDAALRIMESASRSGLFGYTEGQRKLFDFSCDLKKDWSKVVVGQTLWQHGGDGIDKDLRTLLNERDVSAAVYIARHESRLRARFAEVTQSYLDTPMRDRLSRLRVFWVPADFKADNEGTKKSTYDFLRTEITKDLLMHVALGGLTPQDVKRFAASRRPGLPLTILSHVKAYGYLSHKHTAKALDVNLNALRSETERLFIIGFMESESLQGGIYQVTDSGNAMLDICSRLRDYLHGNLGQDNRNAEFEHICSLLGMDYPSIPTTARLLGKDAEVDLQDPTALLLQHVAQADQDGSVHWSAPYFTLPAASTLF